MIQILAMLIQIVVVVILGGVTLLFLLRCLKNRKNKRKRNVNAFWTFVFGLLSFAIGSYSMTSQESDNREELVPVFTRQFGFSPPQTVEGIKAKRFALYDAEAEWIAFTYDAKVFDRILGEDTLLLKILPYTRKSSHIIESIDNPNGPDWIELPDHESTEIYFKEDYLDHIQSDFCLWVNQDRTFIFIQTSNHD
jgi:hypothetical protein